MVSADKVSGEQRDRRHGKRPISSQDEKVEENEEDIISSLFPTFGSSIRSKQDMSAMVTALSQVICNTTAAAAATSSARGLHSAHYGDRIQQTHHLVHAHHSQAPLTMTRHSDHEGTGGRNYSGSARQRPSRTRAVEIRDQQRQTLVSLGTFDTAESATTLRRQPPCLTTQQHYFTTPTVASYHQQGDTTCFPDLLNYAQLLAGTDHDLDLYNKEPLLPSSPTSSVSSSQPHYQYGYWNSDSSSQPGI